MTRRRPRPPPPLDDRDLAAEVFYLHTLWHRGPPPPAPAPVPHPAAAVPSRSRAARRRAVKRKRRRLGRVNAETEDAGPEWPHAPSPPASPEASPGASASVSSSPAELKPHLPGSPTHPAAHEVAISNGDPVPSRSTRRKAHKRKRHGLERDAAETQDAGSERALAPSPPAVHKPWPDPEGPASFSRSKPPPPPPSPGSLAHRDALRAAADFFANHGLDDDDEEEVSVSEGDEEAAAGFFTGMFERDAALRGHYERSGEERQFACMACAGRKARRGRARRFRGCVGLVQHARAATRYGRPGAHRALAAVVCRVLGWDIERLPSIVIDPRGTLGQEDVEAETKGSNANGDEAANELVTSKESAGVKDVEEISPLNCEDSAKNNVYGHETNQEEVAFKTGMEEPVSIDGEKETTELNGGKESSEKENANKDDSLSQDNNGVVRKQDLAIESTEKEVNATVSELEHGKTADDIGDAAVTRLENNPVEGNVDENKEHANLIS